MKETQKDKQVQTSTTNGMTSRAGGPIDAPPDIRKVKGTKKNALLAAVLVAVVGIGGFYAAKSTLLAQKSSVESARMTAGDVARDLLGMAGTEDSVNALGGFEMLPESSKQKIAAVEKKTGEYLENHDDTEAILSKCHISGHDVHYVNRSGSIISHVREGETLPIPMAQAREIILLNKNQYGIAVVIKKDTMEVYNSMGSLEATEAIKKE